MPPPPAAGDNTAREALIEEIVQRKAGVLTMPAWQGEPRVMATLVGVLILGVLDNGLTQMNVDSYLREILIGAIVVAAVALSSFGRRRV